MLLLFSHPVMSDSLQLHGLQHTRPLCPSPSPAVCPSPCLLHLWCHLAILSLTPSSPSALNLSQRQELFQWVSCLHQMTEILALQLQHQSFWWAFSVDFSFKIPGLISMFIQGTFRSLLHTTIQRHQFFGTLPSLQSS